MYREVGMIIDQEYNKAQILRCQWEVVSKSRKPVAVALSYLTLPYSAILFACRDARLNYPFTF